MNIPWCLCGGRKIICGSQLSPSTVWVLGTEIRSSVLAVSAFTRWAILLDPFIVFFHNFHAHILRSILIFFFIHLGIWILFLLFPTNPEPSTQPKCHSLQVLFFDVPIHYFGTPSPTHWFLSFSREFLHRLCYICTFIQFSSLSIRLKFYSIN